MDQTTIPNPPLTSNPNPNLPSSNFPGDSSNLDESEIRKVKLLCSFGGKIFPRPSDGTLRYAGGDTRIVSVRRDITLIELYRKMEDVYGFPVVIRYQLPEEELDSLVSVSSMEDLENMMEECDKITEIGGSGKLRVFLFSQGEIASILGDNFSVGSGVFDRFDGEQKYVEAVNGCSRSSTQNSDGIEGSVIEGSSPAIVSPVSGSSVSFDRGIVANSVPMQEVYGYTDNSNVFGKGIYSSQAFVDPHQVQYMPPHCLNMDSAPRMVNLVSVNHTPSTMIPVKGKLDPLSELDQLGGRFVHPVSDPNHKVFQRPLSQIPPLRPSHLPMQSIETYGLHSVTPLTQAILRFEDCQMCQKSLPHVHSDRVVSELGNASGVHLAKEQPKVYSYFSDDVARIQDGHSVVSLATTENSVEQKFKHVVDPGHCGTYGANKFPDSVLDREQIFGPIAEKIDHSKLRNPLDPLGLSENSQASYGVLEDSFRLQRKQILDGDNFHAATVFHPAVTFSLSNCVHTSNDASLSPPQTYHVDPLQQQNVIFAKGGDQIQVLRPPCTIGVSSTNQASYEMSFKPPQLHHDDSLWKQQVLVGTTPPFFPAKQAVTGKQCRNDSSSISNISCDVMDPLNHAQAYIKQSEGIIDDLNVSTFDILRSGDQLKPTIVPNVGIPVDAQAKKLSEFEDNNTFKLQNGANALLSRNAFITPMIDPEEGYVKPVNPVFLNTDISNEIRVENPSVIGEDSNTAMLHLGGSKLPSSNAFINTGLLPKENSVVPTTPLLSTFMELHPSELANTFQTSTISGSSVLCVQNFEKGVRPIPHIADSTYADSIAEGTSTIWKDEVSQVQNFFDGMACSQRGNVPFPLPCLMVPGQGEQSQGTFVPGSLLENEYPQEIIGSMNAYSPVSTNFASKEPILNLSPKRWTPDVALQLEKGALHPTIDCLINESHPDPAMDFGADYIDKDLHDLVQQVGELVLQSSPPASLMPYSEPKELSPPFMQYHNSSEKHLPERQSTDIAVLLEEGALQPPLDWLIKESIPDYIVGMKDPGSDYINEDLHELAEQVVESVLESSMPSLSSSTILVENGLSEDYSNLQTTTVLGDHRIEDMKNPQSDKLHLGFPMENDIGRLQIIKNSDLEELRELGSGTFGTVYHGKWRGSDVAIKRINDRCFAGKPSEQEKMRADFWNEASKLADLHHPNVVAFYGVVIDGPDGSFATVTEYMVNGSLRSALQRNDKTLDRWQRLLISMDVAFGMEYLHGKNIVHFDLKSDNLLVNLRDPQRPVCKVGDLGLSKVKCKTLISGGVRGTLPWMAPELLSGSSNLVSEKVDVFSFGIVMWELLTGEEPYSDLHYGAIIGGIVSNTLRPAVPDSCDPEWRALMEQCWSAEPTDRPSFTDIAKRLRSMAASLPQKGQAQK